MTGRPQNLIRADIPPAARELVTQMRELYRAAADMTMRELSQRLDVDPSTMSRYFSGERVPRWDLISAFADVTQATEVQREELRRLWAEARKRKTKTSRVHEAARSAYLDGYQLALLDQLYSQAGQPSVRMLANRTGLSRSTVHRALTGESTAGASEVAHGLLTFVPPTKREHWINRIAKVFRETESPTEQRPLYQASTVAGQTEVDQAFAEFARNLSQVRNMIVHGQMETEPHFAAQVISLAATVEAVQQDRSAVGRGSEAPESGHATPGGKDGA